jgi:hypothetical protein
MRIVIHPAAGYDSTASAQRPERMTRILQLARRLFATRILAQPRGSAHTAQVHWVSYDSMFRAMGQLSPSSTLSFGVADDCVERPEAPSDLRKRFRTKFPGIQDKRKTSICL